MGKKEALKIFEDKNVRVIWDDEQEEWYFSVVDVVEVLTDSVNPTDYLKKMRKREPELNTYLGTNCPLILMTTQTGKRRKTLAANPEHLFRIIQSIPSPKAEPFKQWMAQVAAERLDQIQDPELSIEQARYSTVLTDSVLSDLQSDSTEYKDLQSDKQHKVTGAVCLGVPCA